MADNIAEETTQGENTPKAKPQKQEKNFLSGISIAANRLVFILRVIIFTAIFVGIILAIVESINAGSALIFFQRLVFYTLAGVGLFTLTEIINKRKNC
ncbi:MAG TPA: hypothetical protein VIL26_08320 [Clostridia bacterium]